MMKKTLIIVLILIISKFLSAKADIGIGIVIIDFDASTVVNLCDKPEEGAKVVKKLVFYDDNVNQVWKIRNYNTYANWLKPEAYNPLYDLFAFRCKSKVDGWFEVVVNNNTGLTYWLKETEVNKYMDWLSYFKRLNCIKNLINNPILENPSEEAIVIKTDSKDCFKINSMKEDWLEVIIPENNPDNTATTNPKTGWIRWKNGNDLTIKYIVGEIKGVNNFTNNTENQ